MLADADFLVITRTLTGNITAISRLRANALRPNSLSGTSPNRDMLSGIVLRAPFGKLYKEITIIDSYDN